MPFMSDNYYQALSPAKQAELLKTHLLLGYQPETHDHLCVPDVDRYAGMYVSGVQGTGKSALLENMIAHDVRVGNSVIVLDPHGDLITHCLAQLLPDRLVSTFLLDMEDEAHPFSVNVFATGKLDTDLARTQAVERIMHIFEVLWDDVLKQQNLPRYVRAATITLLANPGSTLVDMYALLTSDAYRARLLANVTDGSVIQFWQTNFENLSSAEQLRRVQPLINRLETLFMGRNLVRNIVGQRVTTINFRQAIENREIIFIRLPVKTVAQDARLIGTMLMSQIHSAVFSFANVPEAKRPGVSLYVDEVQNFATPDFAELFTEARKYGMKLTIAHQYRAQLPKFLQDSTITARTKVFFQLTPEDGREMAHEEVVWGFSNCGRGFFNTLRLTFGHDLLSPTVRFPPILVVQTADGDLRWTRKPESGMEQLYHFLFHLRMIMFVLAEEPIGKKSNPSHAAVGQMLTNLPRRAAFVRSAETVGVIYTEDTPNRLQGGELVKRIQAILTQTRKKYGHPKAEIERMFTHPDDDTPPLPSRWENL